MNLKEQFNQTVKLDLKQKNNQTNKNVLINSIKGLQN